MHPVLRIGSISVIGASFLALVTFGSAQASSELAKHCNLPSVFAVAEDEGLPEAYAVFLGRFSGKWYQSLDHLLIVERIDESGNANGYYAWGAFKPWGINTAGCGSWEGSIRNGELHLKAPVSNADVTYRFIMDNPTREHAVNGSWTLRGQTTPGYFVKVVVSEEARAASPTPASGAGYVKLTKLIFVLSSSPLDLSVNSYVNALDHPDARPLNGEELRQLFKPGIRHPMIVLQSKSCRGCGSALTIFDESSLAEWGSNGRYRIEGDTLVVLWETGKEAHYTYMKSKAKDKNGQLRNVLVIVDQNPRRGAVRAILLNSS